MVDAFFGCVTRAAAHAKAILWPIRVGVWARLWLLLLLTGLGTAPNFGGGSRAGASATNAERKTDQPAVVSSSATAPTPLPVFTQLRTQFDDLKAQVKRFYNDNKKLIYQLGGLIVAIGALFMLLFIWLASRLMLVLLRSLETGVVALRQHWNDTRALGESYFRFWLIPFAVVLLSFGAVAFSLYKNGFGSLEAIKAMSGWEIAGRIFLGAVVSGIVFVFFAMVSRFLAVVMHVKNISSWPALKITLGWVFSRPARAVGYAFLFILLYVAASMTAAFAMVMVGFFLMLPMAVGAVLGAFALPKTAAIVMGAVLFGALFLAISAVFSVPVGTFFTYLRIELVKTELN